MSCTAYQEKISDYIDELLSPAERQLIETHFLDCPDCYSCYQDLLAICQASRQLPLHEPSDRVWQNILAHINSAPTPRPVPAPTRWLERWLPFNFSGWAWQPALAAVLLIAIGGAVFYYRTSTPVNQPPIAQGNSSNWGEGSTPRISRRITNKSITQKTRIEMDIVQERINELQQRIKVAQSRWSPELKAVYQQNLKKIDACLSYCQEKARLNSTDLALQAVYESALQAKLEMLKQFSEL
ncbi:MAG: anti-sigma factor [Acidobacteriota bacterium]|nr:anti-sigma factor [Blastocatellia bacterium]MDW8239980.1 anti-sigma factor [Acidobacteriota bacterium]